MFRHLLLPILLVTLPSLADSVIEEDGPPALYGNEFSDRYSVIEGKAPNVLDGRPVEDPVVVVSPQKYGIATVKRTLGTEVPYDRAIAVVSIEHKFGDPIYLKSIGFRTITVSWIGERFVHINKGIGRIVSVEEIVDLVERKWLIQHTISYVVP